MPAKDPNTALNTALNDGLMHHRAGRFSEAITSLGRALKMASKDPILHFHMATAHRAAGNLRAAVKSFKTALSLNPKLEAALVNLGNTLKDLGDYAGAEANYRQALETMARQPKIHYNLGVVAAAQSRLEEAVQHYRQAIGLQADFPEAYGNLGNTLKDQGLIGQAVAAFRSALDLRPAYPNAHSNLLLTLQNDPDATARSLLAEAREWQARNASEAITPQPSFTNTRDPNRRLKIGYISGDLREHSVGFYMRSILAAHDKSAVQVTCYANHGEEDQMTAALREDADQWRPIASLTDDEALEIIRRDGIDILLDLSGHTAHNRLPLFARRAAPVQISYLGYPGSTGIAAMDYRITDAIADPPGQADREASEALLRLPGCFLCYTPPEDAPDVTPLPALDTGCVTFASFNNLSKVSDAAIAAWVEILDAVPGSRFLLKNQSLADPATSRQVLARLAAGGMPPARLELAPPASSIREHLGAYGRVDIALDTFPYNGTTTTSEALWMGVPVIGVMGGRHGARVGASLLTHSGLEELLAPSVAGYVDLAAALAGDLDRLKALRQSLRSRLEQSGVMAPKSFVPGLEGRYRQAWRQFLATN